jgi:Immunoglobulin-like domain of bacterial spore germination.
MKTRLFTGLLISMVILTACQANPAKPAVPAASETVQASATQPAASPATAGITLDQLKNAKVLAPQSQKTVQLQDGKYEGGSGADYVLLQLLPQTAIADLNGDGKADGAVLLAENDGGSGVFVSLSAFIATDDGFTQSAPVLIDDRAQIQELSVTNGTIDLKALIHGAQDSMASPTLQVQESYQLYGTMLTLTGLSETTANVQHQIVIELPKAGDEVSGNIEVKGSMPVAPFENSLVYRFYDENGKVLNEGPFTVKSADVGQPATFDNLLTLPQMADQTHLRLELAELSAKDGSPLSMSSIEIVVK